MKKSQQSGQILLSSLLFVSILIFILGYFYFLDEAENLITQQNAYERNYVINEGTKIANILNEISYNNQNIIISLSVAINSFMEASSDSLIYASVYKYWLNKKNLTTQEEFPQKIFQAYSARTERALQTAIGLSKKNQALINKLKSNTLSVDLSKELKQLSEEESLCLAMKYNEKVIKSEASDIIKKIKNIVVPEIKLNNCSIFYGDKLLVNLKYLMNNWKIKTSVDLGFFLIMPNDNINFIKNLSVKINPYLNIAFNIKMKNFMNKKQIINKEFNLKFNTNQNKNYKILITNAKLKTSNNEHFITENDIKNVLTNGLNIDAVEKSMLNMQWVSIIIKI